MMGAIIKHPVTICIPKGVTPEHCKIKAYGAHPSLDRLDGPP
jgi:hypothetical protein